MKRYAIPAHTLNRKIAIAMMNALAVWRLGILSGLLFFAKTGATPYRTYGRSSFMIIRRSVIPKNTPAGTVSDFKNKSFLPQKMYIQAKSGSLQILSAEKILYTNFNTFFADLLFLKKSVSLIYCLRLIFYISQCFLHSDFNITVTLFQHYIYQTSSQVRLYTQESAVLSSADRTTDL